VNRPKGKPPQSQYSPDFRVEVVRTSLEKDLSVKKARKLYAAGHRQAKTLARRPPKDSATGLVTDKSASHRRGPGGTRW